ncbi:MAG: exo-alpha-sialidase [Nitrospirota bacterium]|nr:exo-alpha-sialidase [Nitrospirota bacterium]
MFALALCLAASGTGWAEPPLVLGAKKKIVEGTLQVSPPALQFDRAGSLHVAWIEKRGEVRGLYTVTAGGGEQDLPAPVQVNQQGSEPDAMHQSPGLAAGPQGEIYVTWATPKPGGPFAADLRLARSTDGGRSFEAALVVNDDGAPINHTFEHVTAAGTGDVYLAWLDNRNKEQSGAGAMFACSRDKGATVEKNLALDGMACPCCRPMAATAPDGSLWVAWRKTFDGNVRDIVVARSTDRGRTFSPPMLVRRDSWSFAACPHRGPSIGVDRQGRLYVGWYTEGADEQPRILVATSDDQGKTFSAPVSLHTSTTSLPDQFRLAVHPEGTVGAAWEEVTGVRKRVVMRVSADRGRTFGPVLTLSEGAKAENPTVAVHESGAMAVAWTEHAWPRNRIVLQQGALTVAQPAALR